MTGVPQEDFGGGPSRHLTRVRDLEERGEGNPFVNAQETDVEEIDHRMLSKSCW